MTKPIAAQTIAPDPKLAIPMDETMTRLFVDLSEVWTEFEARLDRVPMIRRLNAGALTMADYRAFLMNLRQQVVDGARWIATAAANIDQEHFELRSKFLVHAVTEHRDFRMLEDDYVHAGGALDEIRSGRKNVGSEALSAWMFHRASKPNPFDLLGAMFIIEGLGEKKAAPWGKAIQAQLELGENRPLFLLHHGEHDEDHMAQFLEAVAKVCTDPGVREGIVRTARVTARLYALQLESIEDEITGGQDQVAA